MSQLLGGASQCKHVKPPALVGVNRVLHGRGARSGLAMDPLRFNPFNKHYDGAW